jgi:hypothetical protein
MSKYASVLFDTDEYHKIGPFRFPIYHALLPGEAKGIEKLARAQTKSTYRTIKLAQRIAKDKNLADTETVEEDGTVTKLSATQQALDLLSDSDSRQDNQILLDYASDLEEIQNESPGSTEQQSAFAQLLLQFRGETKLPGSKEWVKLSDWSESDTDKTPTPLISEIFQLVLWERDGWPAPEGNDTEPPESDPPQKKS